MSVVFSASEYRARQILERHTARLYPECGCPFESPQDLLRNVVCRNVECPDYGTHRRGAQDDHCFHCGALFTLLAEDPFRGAR